jgi:ABC-type uncharacterized transport system ATPase subunit
MILALSALALMVGMTACKNGNNQLGTMNPLKQERQFLTDAIRHHSPEVQKVDIIGNTVVYTNIFDGIIDIKTYTFDGDECVEVERAFVFPDQMSALRHYRRAIEQVELYDDIQIFKNKVKYDLKKEQIMMEAKGLSKEQLKAKFDNQIAEAKADLQKKKSSTDKPCCK